ncbi:uncharacterized protein LOC117501842 isoform X1 [Thalassophryne amazonica]|uniref:uncharacterized protein LOC117501842 isoform X1 n=1 Tax=Thalassophryne amazonica TaxID=390379 RepID=UPI0014718326|nr:uncharacterized protein LOC117501842 isoform X1 [Thalassophryne amazonica]
MMLLLTIQFLFAGLVLISDVSPTPEDCQHLVKPLSLKDFSMFSGTWYFIEGFTDSPPFKSILKVLETTMLKMVPTPRNAAVLRLIEENKFNGTCYGSKFNITIYHDTAMTKTGTIETVFHLLPTCSDCLLFSINTTGTGFDKIQKMLGLPVTVGDEEIHARAFYLMSQKTSVKEEDLQHFKKQAACAGFSGDSDYQYDSSKEFCAEDEGQEITF